MQSYSKSFASNLLVNLPKHSTTEFMSDSIDTILYDAVDRTSFKIETLKCSNSQDTQPRKTLRRDCHCTAEDPPDAFVARGPLSQLEPLDSGLGMARRRRIGRYGLFLLISLHCVFINTRSSVPEALICCDAVPKFAHKWPRQLSKYASMFKSDRLSLSDPCLHPLVGIVKQYRNLTGGQSREPS